MHDWSRKSARNASSASLSVAAGRGGVAGGDASCCWNGSRSMVDIYGVDDSLDLLYMKRKSVEEMNAATMFVVRLTIECHLRRTTAPYCMCVMSSVRNPGL